MKKIIEKTIIRIQPKERDNMVLPYPYFIDTKTSEVGRQDFWGGNPSKLIGFVDRIGSFDSALSLVDFYKEPKKCIGLFPVFAHKNNEWHTYKDPIGSITIAKNKK